MHFLLTGDATKRVEYKLLEAGAEVSAGLLKVGHHGSRHSNTRPWLQAVAPEYAVIQCGRGRFDLLGPRR